MDKLQLLPQLDFGTKDALDGVCFALEFLLGAGKRTQPHCQSGGADRKNDAQRGADSEEWKLPRQGPQLSKSPDHSGGRGRSRNLMMKFPLVGVVGVKRSGRISMIWDEMVAWGFGALM